MFLLARPDAGSGDDPDDHHEGNDRECKIRVVEGERDGDEVEAERHPVFALRGDVFLFEAVLEAEATADGEAEEEKAEGDDDHGDGVKGDGEGLDLLFDEVGGEEGNQGEAEEEAEVGVEDALVGFADAMDEVVVVDPVNAGEGEGEKVDGERGQDGEQAGKAVLGGDLELEHHDGDDDGDDSVGEGFEAGWR